MDKKLKIVLGAIILVFVIALLIVLVWDTHSDKDISEVSGEKQEQSTTAEATTEETTTEESTTGETTTEEPTTVWENDSRFDVFSTGESTWEANGEHFLKVEMVVKNNTQENIDSWKVLLDFSTNVEISDSWSAKLDLDNDKIIATPEDANKLAEPAKEIRFGVIVKSKTPITLEEFITMGSEQSNDISKENSSMEGNNMSGNDDVIIEDYTTNEATTKYSGSTPVKKYGKLTVKGTNIVSDKGKTVQLKGVSTHGINWFPQYVTKESFKTFRDEWGVELIRLAMYTAEYNGYCEGGNQTELKKLVSDGVEYATDLGMYVIIDWHILNDNNPQMNKSDAIKFFKEMSEKYKNHSNVIYEICNEPNGNVSWDNDIKPYAEEVIATIRKNAPDSIVIVGTPTWSQDVDTVAKNPLPSRCGNVMYALHFYAATHKDDLQNKLKTALSSKLPIFVSEFSICEASGNGNLDISSANKWMDILKQNNISYVAWNISNKEEASAFIKPKSNKISGWSDSELTDSAKWFKKVGN